MAHDFDWQHAEYLMDLMSTQNSHWVPTLQTLKISAFADDEAYLNSPNLKYIPRMRRTLWWNPDVHRAAEYNRSEEGSGINRKLYESSKRQIFAAHQRGVPIMTGTDVTDSYTFAGFSLHLELKELTDSGLSNLEALQAATTVPAAFAGMQDESGSIEIGKLADLVILDQNPLENIENTQSISAVVLNGTYYDSSWLNHYKELTADLATSFHMNVKFVMSMLRSPLMRKQLAD